MARSKIEITFDADLEVGDQVYFEKRYNDGVLATDWQPVSETWVAIRSNPNQVTLGTPTATAGERSAINFMQSINLDYIFTYAQNGELFIGVSRDGNKVTIEVDPQWSFRLIDPDPTSEDVTITITNFESGLFIIDDVEFLEATTNPVCTHYKVQVTANGVIDRYSFNHGSIIESDSETISFEVLRGQELRFTVYSEDDLETSRVFSIYQVPSVINPGILNLTINPSLSGATVTANIDANTVNEFEYSLDNSTWQESNVFSGITEGDYTLYVRDQLGCSFSYDFSVDEIGLARTPYFKMPKANSIRFANRVTWGDCANRKTDENTLSCEANVPKPWKQLQLFQSCDIITTQFRSNYTTITANVVEQDGTETEVPVVKASNYMGLKDKRDARKYNRGNGKTGIYFISGNTYDYDTSADNGDYVLNGTLPEWAVIGTYFDVAGSAFLIEDIVFDEVKNADVLVISNNYTGSDVAVIVSSIYNRENFEEYEFTIDMVDYLNKKVQVRINNNDDTFTNLVHLSEVLYIKVSHENTLEIKYKNSTNTDINYSRGLEHTIRVPIEKITVKPDDESEPHKTDSTAILLNSEVHEAKEFLFQPVTTQMMWLLVLALSHDTVMIDGEGYIKNSNIGVEGPLEETNLYDVTATMLRTGNVFNSDSGQGTNIFAGENLEIPGLVDFGGGFVEY